MSQIRHHGSRNKFYQIASERMTILLKLAVSTLSENPPLAQRYFFLARQLGMRYKVRIPRQFRFLICRHCKRLLSVGVDARVRIAQKREPHVVITCMFCKGMKRIPLRPRS